VIFFYLTDLKRGFGGFMPVLGAYTEGVSNGVYLVFLKKNYFVISLFVASVLSLLFVIQ
jgi:hypothetical protein